MDIRTHVCYSLSKRLMQPPAERTVNYDAYGDWRTESLANSWSAFADQDVTDKAVLDFGCGDGALSLFLGEEKKPKRIVGVDLVPESIDRARKALSEANIPSGVEIEFLTGSTDRLPVADQSFDTLLAFDCLEHVMEPRPILQDWFRVLRPGSKCLIEWYPYKGPWGPHMEALIPIPWAHVIFGERAMFRAAEKIYDLPEFTHRHWDLDENGNKKPNKWRQWSSFEEQGYINKLGTKTFQIMARETGFQIPRFDTRSFGGSPLRQSIGRKLMNAPGIGEYFVSYVLVELQKPLTSSTSH